MKSFKTAKSRQFVIVKNGGGGFHIPRTSKNNYSTVLEESFQKIVLCVTWYIRFKLQHCKQAF